MAARCSASSPAPTCSATSAPDALPHPADARTTSAQRRPILQERSTDMTTSDRFATRAIHAGQEFDPTTGAVIPPIYQTSTFVQESIGQLRGGYEYARSGNPTRTSLETLLAALEGGKHGLSFASGLAAEDTLLRAVLQPGDHVVLRQRRLRRHLPPHQSRARGLGHQEHPGRPRRPRCRSGGGGDGCHPHPLDRDAVQSAHEDQRRRGPGRDRP